MLALYLSVQHPHMRSSMTRFRLTVMLMMQQESWASQPHPSEITPSLVKLSATLPSFARGVLVVVGGLEGLGLEVAFTADATGADGASSQPTSSGWLRTIASKSKNFDRTAATDADSTVTNDEYRVTVCS